MTTIDPIPELVSVLAAELSAGRSIHIPGLGTFRPNHHPATVDSEEGTVRVKPPTKTVAFVSDTESHNTD